MTYASSWAIPTTAYEPDGAGGVDEPDDSGVAGADDGLALPPRILNMTVPQVGHLPLMALRPFFMVSSTALEISFLALHLTQYPSGIDFFRQCASCAGQLMPVTLRAGEMERQLPFGTGNLPQRHRGPGERPQTVFLNSVLSVPLW